jgi:hypothetical protein
MDRAKHTTHMKKCYDSIPQTDQKLALILMPLPVFSLGKISYSASTPRGQRSAAKRGSLG